MPHTDVNAIDLDDLERVLEAERADIRAVRRDRLELLTEREAAQTFGRNEAAMIALRKSGNGPAFVELSRRVFYRFDALRDWLAQIERPAGAVRAGEVA